MTIIRDVTVTSSALPTGASTETTLAAINAKTPALSGGAVPVTVSGTVTVNAIQSGAWAIDAVQSGPWSVDASCSQSGSWTVGATQSGSWNVAATQSGTWTVTGAGGTFPVTDGGGSLTVDGTVGISGSVAVTGPLTDTQLRATPVPISGTVAVTGAATSALQTSGNASLTSIDGKLPSLGQATMAASQPVVIASNQTSIPVAATLSAETTKVIGTVNVAAGQTIGVTGTFFQATQPVSIAATVTTTGAGGTFPVTDSGGSLTIDAPVGTPAFVRLSDGAAPITTLPVSLATLPALVAGAAVVGQVGIDQTTPGTTNLVALSAETTKVIGTVNPPEITIGTNSASGFTTQPVRDAGRTPVRFYAVAAASGATGVETAITLTRSSANTATTTGASFVLTSGKRLRIQAITFATRGNNTATAQTTTFKFRVNTAGAVTTATTPIELAVRSATPATANAWDRVIVPIPDGWELLGDGTIQFGITAAATFVTNAPTWDVTIIGFEY